jgi:multiple sugar transport system substrate-binding protein
MRSIRAAAVGAVTMSLALAATACGGGSSTGGGSNDSPKTLTYWASNQGASIAIDKKVLQPELDKFKKQTGITVKLEVVPWSDLLNRILTATTSGQGPDVLNIGNTWSASLQATGAFLPWSTANFAKIGGKDRFVDSALGSTGATGKDPAAVPLYSMAYALYYNKQIFADAGISGPPTTWAELVADGKKIEAKGKQGAGCRGRQRLREHPPHLRLRQAARRRLLHRRRQGRLHQRRCRDGGQAVRRPDGQGQGHPGRQRRVRAEPVRQRLRQGQDRDADVAVGVRQPQVPGHEREFVRHRPDARAVRHPGHGRAGQLDGGRHQPGRSSRTPNNFDGSTKFVKFMTSDAEQKILNTAYSSIPPVKAAQEDTAFNTPANAVLKNTLATSAAALPQVADESQFETAVGTAVKDLFADAAAGRAVTTASVKAELEKAQQQMPAK